MHAFCMQQLTYTTTSLRIIRFNYHMHLSASNDDHENGISFQGNRRLSFFLPFFLFTIHGSKSCSAVTAAYDEYASTYDDLDGGPLATALGIDDARVKLIKNAKGRVLEVGAGTGLNINNYRFVSDSEPGVTSLTLVDVSTGMLQQAKDKIHSFTSIPRDSIRLVVADATSDLIKTFGLEHFDTVVDTFSL
jgi:ubiquinone/menaquinone biosynthesis C-methylase UbiE